MKLHTQTMLAAAVAAALGAGPAWSQAGPPSGTPGPATGGASAPGTTSSPGARAGKGELARADRDFVTDAAMAGMAEVESSRLAVRKATSPAVRQFAQRMVDDHGSANAELTAFAQSRGMTLPAEVDRSHRKAIDGLDKRSGEDFDRAYMRMQVADHEKSVSRFEKQAKGGKDPELRQWAESKLPALREHLQRARSDDGDRAGRSGGATTPGTSSTQGAASSGPVSGSAASTPGTATK
jgi:putative membrane protein